VIEWDFWSEYGNHLNLKFLSFNSLGHTAVQVDMQEDLNYALLPHKHINDRSSFWLAFEPAASDQFLVELRRILTSHQGKAVLVGIGIIN
jgi:hypothetical protein